jgi:hypothetical protein
MMFTSIYALVGVASLGVALGFLGAHIIDAQERALSRVEHQNKHKLFRIFAASRSDLSDNDSIAKTTAKTTHSNRPSVAVFLLHCIPLFLLIFTLAYLVGRESQWDWAETLYFIVVTGKPPWQQVELAKIDVLRFAFYSSLTAALSILVVSSCLLQGAPSDTGTYCSIIQEPNIGKCLLRSKSLIVDYCCFFADHRLNDATFYVPEIWFLNPIKASRSPLYLFLWCVVPWAIF